MSIAMNIDEIKQKIDCAANKSGRSGEDITLVAVSKTVDIPLIQEAVDYGLTDFGENRPQEIRDKSKVINSNNELVIPNVYVNDVEHILLEDEIKSIMDKS